MLNLAMLFEALNRMTESARCDALAIVGYLMLHGPTEAAELRAAFRPFFDGHPQYLAGILQSLQEWGAIEYRTCQGSAQIRLCVGALTAGLAALDVPFIVGQDVYRVAELEAG